MEKKKSFIRNIIIFVAIICTYIIIHSFVIQKMPTREDIKPPVYVITATYRRAEQLAELVQLGNALRPVENLLWLVIEDAHQKSDIIEQTLNRIGVNHIYLISPMPEEYKHTPKADTKGVICRNRGIEWLRANATEGAFYFADDDNTYDPLIFDQIRYTKKVSMFPVGLVTSTGVSTPIVRNGKFVNFYDGWMSRRFPVDMAVFAVGVKFLLARPNATMPFSPGFEEDGFLRSLLPLENTEIELLASNCTQILAWHTQSVENAPADPINMTIYGDTSLAEIDKQLIRPLKKNKS